METQVRAARRILLGRMLGAWRGLAGRHPGPSGGGHALPPTGRPRVPVRIVEPGSGRLVTLQPLPTDPVALDQGWTLLCGYYAVTEAARAYNLRADAYNLYQRVKGFAYAARAETSSFDEIWQAAQLVAQDNGVTVVPYQGGPFLNDIPTLAAAQAKGYVCVIGVYMGALIAGQAYGHFLLGRRIDFNLDGTADESVVDSYQREDGGGNRYPLTALAQSFFRNWDPNRIACAYQYQLATAGATAGAVGPGQTGPDYAGIAHARATMLGHHFVSGGALERGYLAMTVPWVDGHGADVNDPTPLIRDETTIPDTKRAVAALDDGVILTWQPGMGAAAKIEATEREAVWAACKWG